MKYLEASEISNDYKLYRDVCMYFIQIGQVNLESSQSKKVEYELGLCFCGASFCSLSVLLLRKDKMINEKKQIMEKFEKVQMESFIKDVDYLFIHLDSLKKMNQYLPKDSFEDNPFHHFDSLSISSSMIIQFLEDSIQHL
jgi:hypothetical protein